MLGGIPRDNQSQSMQPMRLNRSFPLLITLAALFAFGHIATAAPDPIKPDLPGFKSRIEPFLSRYCVDCHDDSIQKGDVRLDNIDGDLIAGKSVSLWEDALRRLETGEMPPKKKKTQPTPAERDAVVRWVRHELKKHVTAQLGVPGRVVVRRLSRNEYRNTMRDLLGLPYDIGRDLPPDTTYHGFDHVAAVQELSRSQMLTYLNVARDAIDKAIVSGPRPIMFEYHAQPELDKAGLKWRVTSHGVKENIDAVKAFTSKYRRGRGESAMEPEKWHSTYRFGIRIGDVPDEAKTKTGIWLKAPRRAYNAKGGDWGRLGFRLPYIPRDGGLYRLRIKAGALRKPGLGTPLLTVHVFKKHLADVEVTASADDPQWYEFVFAERDLTDVQIHSDDNRFAKTPVTDIVLNNGYENQGERQGHRGWTVPDGVEIPGVFIDAVEFQANFTADWPPAPHRRILFESPQRNDAEAYAKQVLTRFMSAAFRRPVRHNELAGKMDLFRAAYKAESDFATAIKEPLVATLVSPQFLFLVEDSGADESKRRNLTGYELASRLSYYMWSTMPDAPLLDLAASGKLTQPDVLSAQVDRMLNDPRAAAFHRGFMSQWLGLRKLDDVMIEDDRWVVRTGLRNAMREEPAHFFAEMLRGDHSLLNFIVSDFAVINERLAQHYRIDGVFGQAFRKVALRPEHARGGLLTQGASLVVTTDGMITSPIYRGVWVMEKILDLPPPPAPANVPPLDDAPAKRLSLRDQLAKHREDTSCAACHQKIDPVGWPFERYSILGEYSDYGWGPNWESFHDKKRNKKDLKPDLHGTLPTGQRVETVHDVQSVILEYHQDDVLRSVTKNMLIYALGRPLDISDDEAIAQIIRQVKSKDMKARALIKAVVLSRPFLEK